MPRQTALIALSASLLGCAAITKIEPPTIFPDETTQKDVVGLAKSSPEDAPPVQTSVPKEDINRLIYYRGVSGALEHQKQLEDELAGRTITLAFVNAPAADVTRTIISETLGEVLTVADGVSGTVTLSAPEPVPATDALKALEAVLVESDLALIKNEFGYVLTSLENAKAEPSQISRQGNAAIGYGATIAPVRFAAPSELAQLINPFISDRVTVTADDARSALVLRGPQVDVTGALEAIKAFDAPYLTDRTFGMFKLQYADVQTARSEIETVLKASTPGGGAPAELIALPRLNLLFVAARTRQGFQEAKSWIERLDQPSGGDERRLRYYAVQNTPAEILAAQLNAAFGGQPYGGVTPAATDQTNRTGQPNQLGVAVQPTFRAPRPAGTNQSVQGDRATISTDELNNALIIRATDQEYREILDLIAKMDVASPQVLIEATIAEVTLNDELSYGVRWFFQNAESTATLSDNAQGAVGAVFPGFSYTFFDNDTRVALNTLASITDITVLSAPSIMVLNNQTANLQVGDEVPIVTQQAQGVIDSTAPIVSTLQLRDTGVILEVKPRINASDNVVLEITQEVSDVTQTTTSGIDSPTIQQRKFTSTVSVKNNGTVALGGLIRETYTDNKSGIPILKDIPGLGYAFKTRDISKRRTELIVFLTPRIIRSDADAQNAIHYIRREMNRLGEHASVSE